MKKLILAFLSWQLASCVPVHDAYYVPVGSGNVQKQGPCGVNSRRTLNLNLSSEVDMTVDAISTQTKNGLGPRDKTLLLVTFHIPEGHRVRLDSDVLSIDVPADNRRFQSQIPTLSQVATAKSDAQSDPLAPTTELVGANGVHGGTGMAAPSVFQFSIAMPTNEPVQFTVTFPNMTVDGVPAHIDPVTFLLTSGTHLAGLCQ
jgi:hypothetical protein